MLFGCFAFRKHAKNERDIEFGVMAKYNGKNESFDELNKYLSF